MQGIINEIKTSHLVVTPAMAAEWLGSNAHNRRVRPSLVTMLAEEMRAGRWRETHQGIAFDEQWNLIDGQHRLMAVVASGVPIRIQVTTGIKRDTFGVIDSGRTRTFADRALAAGENATPEMAAIARIIKYGPESNEVLSFGTIMGIIDEHRDAINFVVDAWNASFADNKKQRYNTNAVIGGVVARAYYTSDRARLQDFVRVFLTGEASGPSDWAALKLRQKADTVRNLGRAKVPMRVMLYRRTESALDFFLQRVPVSKIYGEARELFPLPGERRIKRRRPSAIKTSQSQHQQAA